MWFLDFAFWIGRGMAEGDNDAWKFFGCIIGIIIVLGILLYFLS